MRCCVSQNERKNNVPERIALFTLTDSDITRWILIVLHWHRYQLLFNVAVSIGWGTDVGLCEHTFILMYTPHTFFSRSRCSTWTRCRFRVKLCGASVCYISSARGQHIYRVATSSATCPNKPKLQNGIKYVSPFSGHHFSKKFSYNKKTFQ